MKRRSFIKNSSLTAFSIAAFGSIHWNGKFFEGDSITTSDILGPFYRPNCPLRNNLIPAGFKGQVLKLIGTIFQEDGKTPMVNTLIESWQCDNHMQYDNTSEDYLYRGATRTDRMGKYSFKTIVPIPYKDGDGWRPAHIHLRISSKDYQDLITQIYFEGDPHIDKDGSANSPQSVNRIIKIKKNTSNESLARFDIIMGKAFPLSDMGYKKITGLYQLKNGIAEFTKQDDLLFLKMNGQYMEGMKFIGDNTFEGGMGINEVKFEILKAGGVSCKIKLWDFPKDKTFLESHEGLKVFNYSE